MPFMFENLQVYQKSIDLAELLSKTTDTFPKGNYYLIDQLNRAALSIALNLAEGNGRYHPPEIGQSLVTTLPPLLARAWKAVCRCRSSNVQIRGARLLFEHLNSGSNTNNQ
jgi:hypothetical protein